MQQVKKIIIDFLKKYRMDIEDVDIDRNVRVFLNDMENGLAGSDSSLAMIPTYLQTEAEVPANETVIVMDAGGTNFRVATIQFDSDRKADIKNFELYSMPGVDREVSKDEFFEIIAGYLKDVLGLSDKVGFCFSYSTEILPNKDGRLIGFSKGIKAKQVQGQLIGQSLNHTITAMGLGTNKNIVLLNDTVATLLSGRDYQNRSFDSYIGFILGTGTNCSYVEKNSKIIKNKEIEPAGSQIVNIESGGFGKCQRGQIDLLFDQTTADPGVHTFEKMISGAYLGPLCLKVIHTAVDEGLFSSGAAESLQKIKQLETKELNDFLYYPFGDTNPLATACKDGRQNDAGTIYYLVDRLVERAAKLTAINLSSVAIKSDAGKNPDKPICIVAEGTTFYQLKGLKSKIEYYLKDYLEQQQQIYYDIISVGNATLIGAAIAGLTN